MVGHGIEDEMMMDIGHSKLTNCQARCMRHTNHDSDDQLDDNMDGFFSLILVVVHLEDLLAFEFPEMKIVYLNEYNDSINNIDFYQIIHTAISPSLKSLPFPYCTLFLDIMATYCGSNNKHLSS